MIRRILISLADDETSQAAARVTLDLARRFQAGVTSLATVDVGAISSAALAPSIGATYFAHDLVLQMDERLREAARSRTEEFDQSAREAHVEAFGKVGDGVPWQCIEAESRFHDLLVVGRAARFTGTGKEGKGPGRTLRKLLDHAACPLLCVSHAPLELRRVVVGLDGRASSARAFREFLGSGLASGAEVTLFHCDEGGEHPESDFLDSARRYLEAHEIEASVERRQGIALEQLPRTIEARQADLVVLGPHGKGRLAEWALGNTTIEMLNRTEVPLFISS